MAEEKKISRSYRLKSDIIQKVSELAEELGISDTDIITLAVSEFYGRRHPGNGTRLIPLEDGLYDLQLCGVSVMTLRKEALNGIPEDTLHRMLVDGDPNGWAMALLTAHRNHEEIYLSEKGLVDGEEKFRQR